MKGVCLAFICFAVVNFFDILIYNFNKVWFILGNKYIFLSNFLKNEFKCKEQELFFWHLAYLL